MNYKNLARVFGISLAGLLILASFQNCGPKRALSDRVDLFSSNPGSTGLGINEEDIYSEGSDSDLMDKDEDVVSETAEIISSRATQPAMGEACAKYKEARSEYKMPKEIRRHFRLRFIIAAYVHGSERAEAKLEEYLKENSDQKEIIDGAIEMAKLARECRKERREEYRSQSSDDSSSEQNMNSHEERRERIRERLREMGERMRERMGRWRSFRHGNNSDSN